MIGLQDYYAFIIVLSLFSVFLLIMFIYALVCIILIKNDLKSLVDLEYKKFEEKHGQDTVSS